MRLKQYLLRLLFCVLLFIPGIDAAHAANYLTSCGVQQVSITIANGSTTGSQTVGCSVGSGAFLLYQGINPSDTADLSDTNAYLTISGNTITATRGTTGTNKSVVVNAVLVDGDTTNLIKSVQFKTGTMSNGSSTANTTVTGVTTTNAAVAYLGQSPDASQTSIPNDKIIFELTTTTNVKATRNGGTGAIHFAFCLIEFQGTALNSSTQIVKSVASTGTSKSTTITGVTTANTIVIFGGMYGTSAANEALDYQYGQLTASTTLKVSWNTALSATTNNYNCTIVEFVAGVLNQSAQRNTSALSAAASTTATITSSATSSTATNWLGNSSTATTLNPANSEFQITQTNATTLTMTANASATGTGSWEAIQFKPFSAGSVSAQDAIWFGQPF